MSTNSQTRGKSTRVLGRMIGRELSSAELNSVAGGSGRTGPHGWNNSYDTDYS